MLLPSQLGLINTGEGNCFLRTSSNLDPLCAKVGVFFMQKIIFEYGLISLSPDTCMKHLLKAMAVCRNGSLA